MITPGYQQTKHGHCLREFVTPTRPNTLFSDLRAMGVIVAPWALFALAMGVFG